jgi:hypothetical protein
MKKLLAKSLSDRKFNKERDLLLDFYRYIEENHSNLFCNGDGLRLIENAGSRSHHKKWTVI